MNVIALSNLAFASLFVAHALAHEPALQRLEHRGRGSRASAGMCLVEPVDPPPCATPTAASRALP